MLNEAFDLRQIGDYSSGLKLTGQEAKGLLEQAENFIEALKIYITEL